MTCEMKTLMLTGGLLGFGLGLGFGLARQADWPAILWHASAGATVVGLLMRWWGRIWLRGLLDSVEQRRTSEANTGSQSVPATLKNK